ncbi:MAG: IS1595 family transposase [Gammaproteobacteria bacterium]|nr:IS1595 family transposase [Gammaproteobacteria bacterium]MYC25434.1 IS1595 family transposase [Gammaproteobacteria bacterium]
MKYRCRTCGKHFNVRTNTFLHGTRIPLSKWVYAIYLMCTNIKGVSSMRMYRELNVRQPTAWFLIHRIRQAMGILPHGDEKFSGEVEVDETYIGGKEINRHASKKLRKGRGTVGMKPVIGIKHRETGYIKAKVIDDTIRETLQGFIKENVAIRSQVYTDEALAYKNLVELDFKHESVKHSVGEYVKKKASTNGIESFWAMVKRGYVGTYHRMSFKHLHRYVVEFAGRHNIRKFDTLVQMGMIVRNMTDKHLPYKELIKESKKK